MNVRQATPAKRVEQAKTRLDRRRHFRAVCAALAEDLTRLENLERQDRDRQRQEELDRLRDLARYD